MPVKGWKARILYLVHAYISYDYWKPWPPLALSLSTSIDHPVGRASHILHTAMCIMILTTVAILEALVDEATQLFVGLMSGGRVYTSIF